MYFMRSILPALGLMVCAHTATAAFPDHPIRLVVPFTSGGANDLVARTYAEKMTAALGQTVVVENRPGASGAIAAAQVARADADGYTLLLGANAVLVVNEIMRPDIGYQGTDFTAVGIGALAPCILVVSPQTTYATVDELVAAARQNPGSINFASPGAGTQMHLLGELFKQEMKLDITHVPYKGSAPALTDLVGGQVQMMFDNAQSALPQVEGKRIRALAVTGPRRLAALPDVPTMSELGMQNVDAVSWFSIMAPAGTPDATMSVLRDAMHVAMKDPDTGTRLGNFGATVADVDPAQADAFIEGERERWIRVLKAAKLDAASAKP